jgi:glutaredoxin-related protein
MDLKMNFSDRAVLENTKNKLLINETHYFLKLEKETTLFSFQYTYNDKLEYDQYFLSNENKYLLKKFIELRNNEKEFTNSNSKFYKTFNSVFRNNDPLVLADIDYTYNFLESVYKKTTGHDYYPKGGNKYNVESEILKLNFPLHFIEVGNCCYSDYILYRLQNRKGFRICPPDNYDNYDHTVDIENLYLSDMTGNIINNFEEIVEFVNLKRSTNIYISAYNENKLDLYDSEIVDNNLIFMNVYLSAKLLSEGGCGIYSIDDYFFLFTKFANDILRLLMEIFEIVQLYKPINAYKNQIFIIGFNKKKLINDIYTTLDFIAIQTKKQNKKGNFINSLFENQSLHVFEVLKLFLTDQVDYEIRLLDVGIAMKERKENVIANKMSKMSKMSEMGETDEIRKSKEKAMIDKAIKMSEMGQMSKSKEKSMINEAIKMSEMGQMSKSKEKAMIHEAIKMSDTGEMNFSVNFNIILGDLPLVKTWCLPSVTTTKQTINTMRDLIIISDYIKNEPDNEIYPFSFEDFKEFNVVSFVTNYMKNTNNKIFDVENKLLEFILLHYNDENKKSQLQTINWIYNENSFKKKENINNEILKKITEKSNNISKELIYTGNNISKELTENVSNDQISNFSDGHSNTFIVKDYSIQNVTLNGRIVKRFVENFGIESLFRVIQLYQYFKINQVKTIKYKNEPVLFKLKDENYVEAFATPFTTSQKYCSYFSSDKTLCKSFGIFFEQFPIISFIESKWFLFPPASKLIYNKIHDTFLNTFSLKDKKNMSIKLILYRSFLYGTALMQNLEVMFEKKLCTRKKINEICYYDMKEGCNVWETQNKVYGKMYEYEISSYE